MSSDFVLVRTRWAGVHCGIVEDRRQGYIKLSEARRVWRWRGANTLHELSLRGAAQEYTRISEPVQEIELDTVIEVIPCTSEARLDLEKSRWGA